MQGEGPEGLFEPPGRLIIFFEILYGSDFWSPSPQVVPLTGYPFFEVQYGLIVDVKSLLKTVEEVLVNLVFCAHFHKFL